MKMKSVLLSAALLGGLLSVPSFARAGVQPDADSAKYQMPVPVKVVNPTGLFRRHEGEIVRLSLIVDVAGRPHDVKIVSASDRNLAERLLPAVAQWQFAPALKNGAPVATSVILPLRLVEDPNA